MANEVEEKEDDKKPKRKPIKIEDIIVTGQHLINNPISIIPISPATDIALGGGVPEGCVIIMAGQKKVGKTTTCLDLAATARQIPCDLLPKKEKRPIYFYNIEGRLKKRDLEGIHHLNPDDVQIIQSKAGMILSGEDYIEICERLINEKPGAIHIIDSFSQICTSGEMESDLRDKYRADAPVLLAKFCRRICNVVPINKSIVIGITHLIANQNAKAGSSPWTEASGQKIQYQADIKLIAKWAEPWKVGETQIGQDIHWDVHTSALNGFPGQKYVSKLRYGYGLDKAAELVDLAIDLAVLTRAPKSSWVEMPDKSKLQGVEKVRDAIVADEKLYKQVEDAVKTMLGG